MKIIDAHSHIDYITHRIQPDVVGTVICTTRESEWYDLENLIHGDGNIYGAFGVHPWFVDSVDSGFELRLQDLLSRYSSYMVGEIGLDKNRPDMDEQIDVFIKQFDIAVKLKRIVFIHCVGAWDKMLYILKQYKTSDLPIMVFHAFSGDENVVKHLIKNYKDNVYFSFGKNALYGDFCRITQIDSDKILVETDGKSDAGLIDIINKIADIKNNPNMSQIIYNNTKGILKNG